MLRQRPASNPLLTSRTWISIVRMVIALLIILQPSLKLFLLKTLRMSDPKKRSIRIWSVHIFYALKMARLLTRKKRRNCIVEILSKQAGKPSQQLKLTHLIRLVGLIFIIKTALRLPITITTRKDTIWTNSSSLKRKMPYQKTSNSLGNFRVNDWS